MFILSLLLFTITKSFAVPFDIGTEIVGGVSASYPFVAVLDVSFLIELDNFIVSQHEICTGSFIGRRTFVTAGHCVPVSDTSSYTIRKGSQSWGVKLILPHPLFNVTNSNQAQPHDLAILITSTPYDDVVGQIDLNNPTISDHIKFVGYGLTDVGNGIAPDPASDPYEVVSEIVDCSNFISFPNIICSKSVASNSGVCFGDSGGPGIVDDGTIATVSSLIFSECGAETPFGYGLSAHTKLYDHAQFIKMTFQIADALENSSSQTECPTTYLTATLTQSFTSTKTFTKMITNTKYHTKMLTRTITKTSTVTVIRKSSSIAKTTTIKKF